MAIGYRDPGRVDANFSSFSTAPSGSGIVLSNLNILSTRGLFVNHSLYWLRNLWIKIIEGGNWDVQEICNPLEEFRRGESAIFLNINQVRQERYQVVLQTALGRFLFSPLPASSFPPRLFACIPICYICSLTPVNPYFPLFYDQLIPDGWSALQGCFSVSGSATTIGSCS